MTTDNLAVLRDGFNSNTKGRPIKFLFGYVEGTASNNHRYDHWVSFHTSRMVANNPKIKIKEYYNEREDQMVTVAKDSTISREDCKILVYVTICPQSGGEIFKSKSNIGELIKVKDIHKFIICLSRL